MVILFWLYTSTSWTWIYIGKPVWDWGFWREILVWRWCCSRLAFLWGHTIHIDGIMLKWVDRIHQTHLFLGECLPLYSVIRYMISQLPYTVPSNVVIQILSFQVKILWFSGLASGIPCVRKILTIYFWCIWYLVMWGQHFRSHKCSSSYYNISYE